MRSERRQNLRVEWKSSAAFYDDEGRRHPCVVSNLSNGGAMITGAINAQDVDAMLSVFSDDASVSEGRNMIGASPSGNGWTSPANTASPLRRRASVRQSESRL